MQEKSSLKFSGRLNDALKRAGIRASRLAELSGVSKGYVSGLLSETKGKPSIDVCQKFSEVLGVSCLWLLDGAEEKGKPQTQDATIDQTNPALSMEERMERIEKVLERIAKALENLVESNVRNTPS